MTQHFDLVDARAAEQKRTLDADTVTSSASHGEVLVLSTLALTDDDALENLDTLTVSFNNADVNADGIAGCDLRKAAIYTI